MSEALPTLFAFALASLIIELTPGPNMGYLAVLALSRGRRAGLMAVAGVALGLAAAGLAAAFGLAALITAVPALYHAMRAAGVLYLLYLAFEAWRGEPAGPDEAAGAGSGPLAFRRGLITNLLNPKAYLFYAAVLPRFTQPGEPLLQQTLLLTAIYVVVATATHLGVVLLASTLRPLLTGRKERTTRRIFAGLLVILALWLGWSTRI